MLLNYLKIYPVWKSHFFAHIWWFFIPKTKGGVWEGRNFLHFLSLVICKKKLENSVFLSAALHGEIGLLKLQILFCKNLRTTWLHQILGSFRRVQLVPFSFLSWFTNVSFAWRWLIEIEKCSSRLLKIYIWKIWMRIKWEAWGGNLSEIFGHG